MVAIAAYCIHSQALSIAEENSGNEWKGKDTGQHVSKVGNRKASEQADCAEVLGGSVR